MAILVVWFTWSSSLWRLENGALAGFITGVIYKHFNERFNTLAHFSYFGCFVSVWLLSYRLILSSGRSKHAFRYTVYLASNLAIMLRGSRGPDPLENKKVFACSDYLTASASRRYFNLGGILVQEKWTSY